MEIKYFFYFLTGGIVVSVVTFFASHAKGLLAAFLANLPVVTMITFLTIYFESGQKAVVSYAEGLIIMLFPWLAYIFSVVFLTRRTGFLPALIIGISLYLVCAYFIMNAKKIF
jgi:uncharacterized membrane protein (GlpM family)